MTITALSLSCTPKNRDSIDEQRIHTEEPIVSIDEPTLTIDEPITQTIARKLLFVEDIAEVMPKSTPLNTHVPLGLQAQFNIEYQGAFRVEAKGESSSNFAVGTLAYNPKNNSLFMAGHSREGAIAEFAIPESLSFESVVKKIPKAKVLQSYVSLFKDPNKKRINGLLQFGNNLLVTSEIYYDASGKNKDNLQVLNIDNISEKPKGMLQLNGEARIAGYMSPIPESMHSALGAKYLVGWSSVNAIDNRYSHGPSLATFNPQDALDNDLQVPTAIKQVYPFKGGRKIVSNAATVTKDVSPIWSSLAKGRYGFIVPGTSIFMVVGSNGGIHSGIGYKIIQDNGNKCGGYCSYDHEDNYSYFWLFDINEMIATENPWDVQPFSYGKWEMPFKGSIIGATWDEKKEALYMSISGAGRIGKYDRPPMIVVYKLVAKVK